MRVGHKRMHAGLVALRTVVHIHIISEFYSRQSYSRLGPRLAISFTRSCPI